MVCEHVHTYQGVRGICRLATVYHVTRYLIEMVTARLVLLAVNKSLATRRPIPPPGSSGNLSVRRGDRCRLEALADADAVA